VWLSLRRVCGREAPGEVRSWRRLSRKLSPRQPTAAGNGAAIDRYIGYWEPYATSHQALDADEAVKEEVRLAARTLLEGVQDLRRGRRPDATRELHPPRDK